MNFADYKELALRRAGANDHAGHLAGKAAAQIFRDLHVRPLPLLGGREGELNFPLAGAVRAPACAPRGGHGRDGLRHGRIDDALHHPRLFVQDA